MVAKAAALLHSLLQHHPFADGNKRVSAHAMLMVLVVNGYEPTFGPAALTELTLAVARGEVAVEARAIWLRQRTRVG